MREVEWYIADEQRFGRWLDYGVIAPRLQGLYAWSAEELDEPRVLELVRDGNPIYAWPFEERHVWRSERMPFAGAVLERVTRGSVKSLRRPKPGSCSPSSRIASFSASRQYARSGYDKRASSDPAAFVSMTSGGATTNVRPARIT